MVSVTDPLFRRLARSTFRRRFHLGVQEYHYCQHKGENRVRQHATEFIYLRLAPAEPLNDGRQTPMRGHPVFIAQHATATCCRGCLAKWHNIAPHQALTPGQQQYLVEVIMCWLQQEMQRPAPSARPVKPPSVPDDDRQMTLFSPAESHPSKNTS